MLDAVPFSWPYASRLLDVKKKNSDVDLWGKKAVDPKAGRGLEYVGVDHAWIDRMLEFRKGIDQTYVEEEE